MQILMTGATGFLGTALSAYLEARGHRVVRLGSHNGDLRRPDSLDPFDDCRYDQIYHLAAWTQAGDFCLRHPGEQWVFNQQINTNVLAWWRERQPQAKLIAMGTSCAYPCDREHVEENYLEGQPIDSLFTYAMTKRMLYVGLRALTQQHGLCHLCLVPSTLYGPGYHTDGRQTHFIFDLIRKILRAKMGGPPPVLWGDGHQRRELVYIDDFVSAAVDLAGTLDSALINIGAGEEFSIREFARMICDHVGYEFERIEFDTTKYVGAKSKCLSITKLRKYLPDRVQTPLHLGLTRTIEWFQDNLEIIDSERIASHER
jgi:GDP-L-fucose synthase